MKKLSGLALCLVACSKPAYVEPALQPYFLDFAQSVHHDIAGIEGRWGDPGVMGEDVGRCLFTDPHTVEVQKTAWEALGEDSKRAMVFHELGHCALGRKHLGDVSQDGCPISLMYPKPLWKVACFVSNWPYYTKELGGLP